MNFKFGKKNKEEAKVVESDKVAEPYRGPWLPLKVPTIMFREAREEDIEQIETIAMSTPEIVPFNHKGDVENYVRYGNNRKLIVALIGKQVIGFVFGESDFSTHIGCITYLAVIPEYRKNGIGMALVKECEEQLNAKTFYLFAASEEAMMIFGKMGFKFRQVTYYMTKREEIQNDV